MIILFNIREWFNRFQYMYKPEHYVFDKMNDIDVNVLTGHIAGKM